MPRPKGSKNLPKTPDEHFKVHARHCNVCRHKDKLDIELFYKHYIPIRLICKVYKLTPIMVTHHALITGLDKLRDRKSFYQHIIGHYDPDKITAENAIEAAKQLDRIERVIVDNPVPSNIVINWGWAKEKHAIPDGTGSIDSGSRLPALTNAGKIPSVEKAV